MTTKSFKFLALTAAAVLAIACAKEPVAGGEGETGVSFSIEVPGSPETKAAGDGTSAKTLYYQAFDESGAAIEGLGVQSTTLTGKTATVKFQLIKDQTYNFVFWAQTDADGYYSIDATDGLKKITANYTDKKANDENFDAFYAVKNLTVTGPISETVELTRPFAQINIGTAGAISAGTASREIDFTGATSTVTVKNIPTVFAPLADKDVTGTETVTFGAAEIPAGNITVSGADYKYLSMNYVFAPSDRSIYDITAEVTVEGKTTSVSIPGAPLQRNYRTNVVGNLLTAGAGFDVSISSGFAGEESFDLTNVKSAAELKAALVNGGDINIVGDITATDRFSLTSGKVSNISIGNGVTLTGNLSGYNTKLISLYNSDIRCTLSGEGTILSPTTQNGSAAAAIELEDNANELTIDGNLTIKGRAGTVKDKVDACIIIRAGKVTVNGGHFIASRDVDGGDNPAIYLYSPNGYRSELIINGGTFECESGDSKFLINIDDNYREHETVKIYGGTFIGFNPADNDAEGPHTNFVADGYTVTAAYDAASSRTAYTVVKATTAADEDALKTGLSKAGAAVTLSNDTEISYLSVSKKATLNLNGKTLNCNEQEALRTGKGGNLSIVGPGTIKATAVFADKQTSGISVRNGGIVNIYDGVTVDGGSGSNGNYAVRIVYGTVNIYGGYFHSGADANGGSSEVIYLESAYSASSKANLNIYGGVFECDGDAKFLINMQDSYRSKCSAKIYGGTFVGFNPADNTAEGEHTNFVASGYKSVETTDNGKQAWKVEKE